VFFIFVLVVLLCLKIALELGKSHSRLAQLGLDDNEKEARWAMRLAMVISFLVVLWYIPVGFNFFWGFVAAWLAAHIIASIMLAAYYIGRDNDGAHWSDYVLGFWMIPFGSNTPPLARSVCFLFIDVILLVISLVATVIIGLVILFCCVPLLREQE